MMFSSTIIGLKFLPTTILHHRHTGELIISVLLLQDLLAIFAALLLVTAASSRHGLAWSNLILIALSLPTLMLIGYLAQRYFLIKLFAQFHTCKRIYILIINRLVFRHGTTHLGNRFIG